MRATMILAVLLAAAPAAAQPAGRPADAAAEAEEAESAADWSCECLTFDGSPDNCHFFAELRGDTLSFGAFETSGEGPARVVAGAGETVVEGTIVQPGGTPLDVFIALPASGDASVWTGERSGPPAFTARCSGMLPAAEPRP